MPQKKAGKRLPPSYLALIKAERERPIITRSARQAIAKKASKKK